MEDGQSCLPTPDGRFRSAVYFERWPPEHRFFGEVDADGHAEVEMQRKLPSIVHRLCSLNALAWRWRILS